jgi:TonB-linked SusC/RagA family outer membrane protein
MKKERHVHERVLFIMKVSLLHLLVLLSLVSMANPAKTAAQALERKVSIDIQNGSFRSVLSRIERQAEVKFIYQSELIPARQKVSINITNEKLGDALQKLFIPRNIAFEAEGNQIILTRILQGNLSPEEAGENQEAFISVSGQVVDENTAPLPGVSILEKGTTNGTTTDENGRFSLRVADKNSVLLFSFIGYLSEEITVGEQTSINISLMPDIQSLSEVVVVGYGEQKKATLTSSVAVIKGKEINTLPVNNVSNALSGRAQGVITRSNGGEPGNDAARIYIRGRGTQGNTDPLVVVDGILDRDLNSIDARDIESITVLKDASAVAPYGARGANGVILVTTKRGKSGKPTISYSNYYGVQQPTKLPEFESSANYARLFNEASQNVGQPARFTEEEIQRFAEGNTPEYPNTDWFDAMMGQNPIQVQHNLSVSGGAERIRYFVSLSRFNQEGFWKNASFKRHNFRANIDADVTKDLTLSFDLSGYTSDRSTPAAGTQGFLEAPMRVPSIFPVKNAAGQYVTSGVAGNSAAEVEKGGYNKIDDNLFYGTLSATYRVPFVQGLSLIGRASFDKRYTYSKNFRTPYSLWRIDNRANGTYSEVVPNVGPSLTSRNEDNQNIMFEAQVNYARTFGDHQIGGLLVYNQQEWMYNSLSGTRINYTSALIDQLSAGPALNQSTDGTGSDGARQGIVGRVTYDFKSKYLFESNFRYDGSMNFPAGKRFGFFPSFALGWRISEESFFKNNLGFVNNLKLRVSWGRAGNDRVAPYGFLTSYGAAVPYVFGGNIVPTNREARLANPNFTWEKATLTDIGLETSMWNGRLSLEADYFYKKTTDILRPTGKVSSVIGQRLPDENIGIVENQGVEFLLGHTHQLGDFKYTVQASYTFARNKIIEMGEAVGTLNDPLRRRTGRMIDQYFGRIAEGVFTSADEIASWPSQGAGIMPGDIKYRDINGPDGVPDGKIDGLDETAIGYSPVPEIVYGLNLGAQYKGFDLTFFLQGAARMSYRFTSFSANAFDNGGNIMVWQAENRFRPDAPDANAKYPRLTPSPVANNTQPSDYWLRNMDYWRVKNVEIGYNFNSALLSRLKIATLRLYLSGQNLFTRVKDDISFVDPEAGHDRGQFYPQVKVYTAGLNLSF